MADTVITSNTMTNDRKFFSWKELVQFAEEAGRLPRREADPKELANLVQASAKGDPAKEMRFSALSSRQLGSAANAKEQLLDIVAQEYVKSYAKVKFKDDPEKQEKAAAEWLEDERAMSRVRGLKPLRQLASQYAKDKDLSNALLSGAKLPESKFMHDLKLVIPAVKSAKAPEPKEPLKEQEPLVMKSGGGPSFSL